MRKIYTSYFGNLLKLKEKGIKPISIALFPPNWYVGDALLSLAPDSAIFAGYKENIVNEERFKKFYEYKIKRFLQDCAQGMTPEKPWLGIYDATGGQIIVKEDGDIVCYHIYELNRFREFLFNSTKFEGASTSEDAENPGHPRSDAKKKFFYGWVYEEDGKYYIKINLQVRSK